VGRLHDEVALLVVREGVLEEVSHFGVEMLHFFIFVYFNGILIAKESFLKSLISFNINDLQRLLQKAKLCYNLKKIVLLSVFQPFRVYGTHTRVKKLVSRHTWKKCY